MRPATTITPLTLPFLWLFGKPPDPAIDQVKTSKKDMIGAFVKFV